MEVIGTTPRMGEVELRREQQPRVESGTETEKCRDDYRDIGGSECQEHILEHILELIFQTKSRKCKSDKSLRLFLIL